MPKKTTFHFVENIACKVETIIAWVWMRMKEGSYTDNLQKLYLANFLRLLTLYLNEVWFLKGFRLRFLDLFNKKFLMNFL